MKPGGDEPLEMALKRARDRMKVVREEMERLFRTGETEALAGWRSERERLNWWIRELEGRRGDGGK